MAIVSSMVVIWMSHVTVHLSEWTICGSLLFFYKIADFVTIGKWELKQRGWELVINREVGHMELLVEVLLEKLRL